MNNAVDDADDVFRVNDANYIHSQFETIWINNKEVKFMADTAATVSLLPTKIFVSLNITIDRNATSSLETYDGQKLTCVGVSEVEVIWKGNQTVIKFRVVKSSRDYGLLGRDVLSPETCVMSLSPHQIR